MRRWLSLVLVGVVVVAAAMGPVHSDNEAPVDDNAGLVIHIDPVSGKPVAPTEGAVPVLLDAKMRAALNSSWDGLKQVPSPVPGGGVIVHLEERFQHGYVAVTDGQNGLKVRCISNLPQDENGAKSTPLNDEGGEQ